MIEPESAQDMAAATGQIPGQGAAGSARDGGDQPPAPLLEGLRRYRSFFERLLAA